MKYHIVKSGIYDHGVMWIGDDLDIAKSKADYFASNHDDGYHNYEVRAMEKPVQSKSCWEALHSVIYTGDDKKGAKI